MITDGHNFLNNKDDFFTINKDAVLLKLVNKKVKTVLEVGCGKGTFLYKLSKKGVVCEGIDFKSTITEARKICGERIKFYEGDFNSHTFKKEYDCIIASGVIEHIKDDLSFVKKLYKLLNKNGQLILLTSAHPRLYSIFDENVHHYRRYSRKQLITVIKKANFKIKNFRYWNMISLPYLIYAKIFHSLLIDNKQLSDQYFNKIIDLWFKIFENKVSFPLGVDLIIVAEKNET